MNAANPKSVLFAAAVLALVLPREIGATGGALVVANHFALEAAFYSVVALVLSHRAVADRYVAAKPILDRVSAGIMGALGLRLLLGRDPA